MKAFILTRVSSKEQEDGYSLAAQKKKLLDYCQVKGLEVSPQHIYGLIESSTKGKRSEFWKMIANIEKSKERIALVCDKIDRLMRSFNEQNTLNELMKRDKLEIHFVTESQIINKDSTSQQKMFWNFGIMMAQSYTDSLSDNVRRSIDYKITHCKEWCSNSPPGYKNIRDDADKSCIILDPDRDFLIRRMFEEYSLGSDSIGSITRKLNNWGFLSVNGNKISTTTVHRLFHNPFYYGEMRVKGKIYPHKYPPLISRELWEKCNNILHGRRHQFFKYAERPNLFRGILKCAKCGNAMSPSTAKGHVYLSCSSYAKKAQGRYCGNQIVREDAIADQLANEVFSKFYLPKEDRDKLLDMVNASLNAETDFMLREAGILRKQDDDLRRQLNTLVNMAISESITQDQYAEKKRELESKRREIEDRLNSLTKADDRFILTIESLIFLASSARDIFPGLELEEKHALIKLTVSNLVVEDRKARYSLASPFDLLADLSEKQIWRPYGDSNPGYRRERAMS